MPEISEQDLEVLKLHRRICALLEAWEEVENKRENLLKEMADLKNQHARALAEWEGTLGENHALRQQLVEAQKDSRRLDWAEQNAERIHYHKDEGDSFRTGWTINGLRFNTLRNAIDFTTTAIKKRLEEMEGKTDDH